MERKKQPNQGFRRLWQRALFHQREFHRLDRLNEYDEDYSRLESEERLNGAADETER